MTWPDELSPRHKLVYKRLVGVNSDISVERRAEVV